MSTDTQTHTSFTLDRMAGEDRWLGFGYLGERAHATDEDRQAADALALQMANDAGLTYDKFFEWANSKDGRWFGDCMFGGYPEQAHRYGPRA